MSSNLENKEDEYLNKITLKYLTNFDYQNDSPNTLHPNKNNKKIYKNKEKKFYKKRILNIIKQLINFESKERKESQENRANNSEGNIELFYTDIKTTFDIFIKTCIDYLKAQDKCDIIQNDYKNLDIVTNNTNNTNNTYNTDFNKQINSLMMRKIINKKNSIDSFVKRTPINNDKYNSKHQINKIIPHKKKINLTDPELKNKGLPVDNTQKSFTKQNTLDATDTNIGYTISENISKNKNNIIYKESVSNNNSNSNIITKNGKQKENCKGKNKTQIEKNENNEK